MSEEELTRAISAKLAYLPDYLWHVLTEREAAAELFVDKGARNLGGASVDRKRTGVSNIRNCNQGFRDTRAILPRQKVQPLMLRLFDRECATFPRPIALTRSAKVFPRPKATNILGEKLTRFFSTKTEAVDVRF